MDRTGIGEDMCGPGYDIDCTVYMFCGFAEAAIGRIDVRVAGPAGRSRCKAGMGGVGRREAVAGAAAGCR